MAKTSEVTFYTTPSSWGNDRYGPLHAYDRVAGMMIDGETLWQDRSQISSENDYHLHDTDVTTYTLPTEFAKNVGNYFYNFYADPLRIYQLADPYKNWQDRSYCHRFGATILTGKLQTYDNSYSLVTEMVGRKRLANTQVQPLGELAVVGSVENRYGFDKHAVHTMISLGDGNYIQTACLGGNMAITALRPVVDYYLERSEGRSVEAYGSTGSNIGPPDHRFVADMASFGIRKPQGVKLISV